LLLIFIAICFEGLGLLVDAITKKYSTDELLMIKQQLDKFDSIDWDWEVFRGGGQKNFHFKERSEGITI